MAPFKRKAFELDSDDEEELAFGKQILPVANLPETFDGEPTDGMQYLFTVRREFYRLPHITSVPNPYATPPPPSSLKSAQINFNGELKESCLPTESWRTTFERRFVDMRQNLAQPTISVGGLQPMDQNPRLPDKKERDRWWAFLIGKPELDWNPPKRPKVEKGRRQQRRRDRDDNQLLGPWVPVHESQIDQGNAVPLAVQEVANTIPPLTPQSELVSGIVKTTPTSTEPHEDFSIESASHTTLSGVSKPQQPPEPTPWLLREINHGYAIHLLMYFSHWISLYVDHIEAQKACSSSHDIASTQDDTMSIGSSRSATPVPETKTALEASGDEPVVKTPPHSIANVHLRWVFALLARVEDQTSADEMAQLRNLARACTRLIKHGPRDLVAGSWMAITCVAGHWGQRDLWMDAEEMLAA